MPEPTDQEVWIEKMRVVSEELKQKIVEAMVIHGSTCGMHEFEAFGTKMVLVFGPPDRAKQMLENIE